MSEVNFIGKAHAPDDSALSVSDAVASRRSIRAFLDTPVPLDILTRVFEKARFSPSGCNFQPWEATVLSGEPLAALQEKLRHATKQDPVEYEIVPTGIPENFMARQREVGAQMYAAEGIDRNDGEKRATFAAKNLTSFGAPVLLLCHVNRIMGPPQWSDVGMWLQTVMLLLREEGLDSCPQEYMALYARLIKEHIGVSEETHILFCGLAIGYRDSSAAVNRFDRGRVPLEQQLRFVGF